MKPAPLTLLLAGILCSFHSSSQIFFNEHLNLSSCLVKGDLQCSFSTKATHIYRDAGRTQSYGEQAATTEFHLYNQWIDAGYAVTNHLMVTASYMHERQDGNIYIVGNAKYGLGDRGAYSGNRWQAGAAYMQRLMHVHYLALHGNVYMGNQRRTPNADDQSGIRFTTSYAGFNLCPVYGVKTDVIDFSIGPRLNYQQFYNGKAEGTAYAANTDLYTAGAVADFSVGYRCVKLSFQTGLMGRLSHKDYNYNHTSYHGEDQPFYTNIGMCFYWGKYYRVHPQRPEKRY